MQSVGSSVGCHSHRSCPNLALYMRATECNRHERSMKLRTVLPELAQVNAVLQRLVQDEQSKVLRAVVVLQQLRGPPFERLRCHIGEGEGRCEVRARWWSDDVPLVRESSARNRDCVCFFASGW